MKQYLILTIVSILMIVSCSQKQSSTDLLASSEKYLSDNQFTEAISTLKELVDKFPDTEEAPQAQYKLGDIYMAHTKDFDQAIIEYKKVRENYPDSQSAVNAQFMLGYVYANYLNDDTAARSEYKRFIEVYSDRADEGLIQSVEFELKYLGKQLDEIPELKHISS